MSTTDVFTVEIQAANDDGTIWQAVAPAETIRRADPRFVLFDNAADLAWAVAEHQDVADGARWRVRVWEGAAADTGVEPAAEYYSGDLDDPA